MRAVFLAIVAFGIMGGAEAAPQPMSKNERAYTITLICVLAARDKNDADIQRTMDAVRKMGKTKGYADKKVSGDLITMASVVGVQLRDEPTTVDRNRGICRQLGLLG
jgi:hypothetical protein